MGMSSVIKVCCTGGRLAFEIYLGYTWRSNGALKLPGTRCPCSAMVRIVLFGCVRAANNQVATDATAFKLMVPGELICKMVSCTPSNNLQVRGHVHF